MVDDVSGAQLVSRLIKRWSDENKVEINYKKCGIMELKRNQVEEQPAKGLGPTLGAISKSQ